MVRVGEAAWLLEFASGEQALSAFHALAAASDPEVLDLVPGARTLLVVLRPEAASSPPERITALAAAPPGAWGDPDRAPGRRAEQPRPLTIAGAHGRVHEIAVRYDGDDLEQVARQAGLAVGEIVARHAEGTYRVAFLGFQPGFAYLSGLPAELRTPRRASPRPRVPAGSVAIGGEWSGIYPAASPGGWNLIGSTDVVLFSAQADPPALLAPGDLVRFVPA